MYKTLLLLALAAALFLASGCSRRSQEGTSSAATIEVAAIPFPAAVGQTRLVVHVLDSSGAPVNDAQLAIKGDMTHAGMVPLLAEQQGGGEDGYYRIPFEWTMAGDWVVTVQATLPDGTHAQQRFDFMVATQDEAVCTDDDPQGSAVPTRAAE
ncbi:MAG: FixH family protein [Candidatus Promineifilaceae bacterium]|jgi:hypothetical protein